MKIGIVWLPNVGKSTLFNALTKSYAADAANFPFCTIDPNVGIVDIRDPRMLALSKMSNTKKIIFSNVQFVDIAGLVKWASQGEGMGNAFLSHIREVDTIVQVLRHFSEEDINHVEWSVDPIRDKDIINLELMLSDLERIEKRLPLSQKKVKSKEKDAAMEVKVLTLAKETLEKEQLLTTIMDWLSDDERAILKGFAFLTAKPFVYAINVSQEDMVNAVAIREEFVDKLNAPVVIVCAALESELLELSDEDRAEFLTELLEVEHLDHVPTLDDLIKSAFDTLGLMYYFTTWEKETRAWTVKKNSTAPQAAAAIHTDFERWFIKAEVVSYEDLIAAWSWSASKEAWKLKLQGKDYIVQDGDVIVFKFNV